MFQRLRVAAVLTLSLVGAGALLLGGGASAGRLLTPSGRADDLAVGVAGLGLAVSGCWLTLVTLSCVRHLMRGGAPAARATRPGTLRHWLLRACGPAAGAVGAAVLSLPHPALADEGEHVGARSLGGLPLPERPVLTSPRSSTADPPRPAPAARTHTVAPGESLWGIASGLLGPRATPAEVDRSWRAIHRLNRERIGPDPDLVVIGTRLDLPASLRSPRPSSR